MGVLQEGDGFSCLPQTVTACFVICLYVYMYVRVYVRVYVCELTQIAFEESRVLQVCPMRASDLG